LPRTLSRGPGLESRRSQNSVFNKLPDIPLAEMKAGFQAGATRRRADNEGLLLRFMGLSAVGVLYADRETIEVYARLFAELRGAGTPIPTNDLWIASLAVQHQLTLATRDAHFAKVRQVALL